MKIEEILPWLLESDPAIRWQVMRDLTDALPSEYAAERAKIETEGWGARLINARGDDGQWAGGACFPAPGISFEESKLGQPWISTLPTLQLLYNFGIDPASLCMRNTTKQIKEVCCWEHDGQRFFDGEVEPCINGRTLALGVYFGHKIDGILERLLNEQLSDGGWNCEAENGSTRSSFDTTINVLEGLSEYERHTGGSRSITDARQRGEKYLLERKLFRRKSNGEIIKPAYLQLSFPHHWHYDILRALGYFRCMGNKPDIRVEEAITLLITKRQPDGSWLLDHTHPGAVHFEMEKENLPSKWITLRAMRVLKWSGN